MRFRTLININLMLLFSSSVWAMETQLEFYKPFGSKEKSGKHVRGDCKQPSQRIQRDDAWRCSYKQGAVVVDPCFIKQYSNHKEALCLKAPWGNQSTIYIDLETPVGSPKNPVALDFSRSYPWALELVDGEKCLAVDEGKMYDHMPIRYECEQGGQLFGSFQRCKMPWTVLREREGVAGTVEIRKAWF